tara:strand:- start:1161 stop:2429 length:1269 start_codon:yes stop_codon:yes gene_type:complete
MKFEDQNKILTAVDIGTTTTRVVIAEIIGNDNFKILGFGQSFNVGIKNGIVESITKSAESLERAIEIAEKQANVDVEYVTVGITGQQIRGINNTGVITINSPGSDFLNEKEITQLDINRVLEHTKAVTLPPDRRVLHILPQEFNVDNHKGIKDPLGMVGHRLEASVHLVTSDLRNEKNIETCLRNVGLEIKNFVLNPLASAEAVLDHNEKNLGAAVVDIGGGTTDVIVYHNNGVRHTGVVPIGSNNITSDIAHGLQTTFEQAEELKLNYGCAKSALANDEKNIRVKGIGGREGRLISQKDLTLLIEPRMVEILAMALSEIKKKEHSGFLTFGVILTGGGSLLTNISDLAIDVFQQPIKISNPIKTGGFEDKLGNPSCSSVIGLVKYEIENKDINKESDNFLGQLPKVGDVVSKIKNIFNNFI